VAPFLAGIIIILFSVLAREPKLIARTLWIPGVLLFGAAVLPWYVAVQIQNPEFFGEFILKHNLARFSSNLYHHPEPFWYYIPVVALALLPWIVFVVAAFAESARVWWAERKSTAYDVELQFRIFAGCWLVLPVAFFSISQSKLPGYILPSVPAGAILLADYLLRHRGDETISKWIVGLHAIVASAPIIPAVLIAYLVTQHRIPGGRPMFFALGLAIVLCIAIALTLLSRMHLRLLRFVTLIAVVLVVAAVLKVGTTAIDQKLSARPLALELASVETKKLPLAVYGVQRELEYGLAFYRNQAIQRYESGNIPASEHLLIAPTAWMDNVAKATAGRHVSFLGHYAPQAVDYYWVAAAGSKP
jgi:4-amino-4-deoxy-L-arabinose transferase-like glycosyltransferase